ncbi:MAG: hypothetical protein AB1586_26680 [Pseudomonadota bacterium]
MDKFAFHNTDPRELARRRRLASARLDRERERQSLVAKLAFTQHRATQLRAWIGAFEGQGAVARSPELTRMLDWARGQLEMLDAEIDPVRVAQTLFDRNLFPEVDELHDPFGDPPPHQPWGR